MLVATIRQGCRPIQIFQAGQRPRHHYRRNITTSIHNRLYTAKHLVGFIPAKLVKAIDYDQNSLSVQIPLVPYCFLDAVL